MNCNCYLLKTPKGTVKAYPFHAYGGREKALLAATEAKGAWERMAHSFAGGERFENLKIVEG